MIHYLKGEIKLKTEKFVVIETQGVGYKIFCSPKTLKELSEGQKSRLFTYLHLRENIMELYGFLTKKELELFEILNEISGIGPKTAILLASFGSLEKLKEVLERGKILPEIKGIGRKKTQRILLELTGKIRELTKKKSKEKDSALDILISLGFSRKIAKETLSKISVDITNVEQRIKEALKILGSKRR